MGSKSEALSNRITILSSGQARRYANSMRGPAQRRFEVRQCSLVSGARAGQANCTGRSQPCCQPASRQRERRLARQRNDARTDSNDYHRLVCRAKPPLARLTESMRPRAANAAKGLFIGRSLLFLPLAVFVDGLRLLLYASEVRHWMLGTVVPLSSRPPNGLQRILRFCHAGGRLKSPLKESSVARHWMSGVRPLTCTTAVSTHPRTKMGSPSWDLKLNSRLTRSRGQAGAWRASTRFRRSPTLRMIRTCSRR